MGFSIGNWIIWSNGIEETWVSNRECVGLDECRLEVFGELGWSLDLYRYYILSLNDVFIIFMEYLFFLKGRFILGVVLVNFRKVSVWNYVGIGFKDVNFINL